MIFVFAGPTIHHHEARKVLDAVYLPPVSQGDVYRVSLHRPKAIGIIDGYFDQVPSVWHKEILWAMSQGIAVFGASSMGALRAAELAPFGMIGVGRIFDSFRDGILEDDDEVAILHGDAESGYKQISEAMVNIRETLRAAERHGVIAKSTRERMELIAKQLHYADRHYRAVLQRGRDDGIDSAEIEALVSYLPSGAIDQKRLDAVALLERMKHVHNDHSNHERVRYTFEHTTLWDELRRSAGSLSVGEQFNANALPPDALLDEVRLSTKNWPALFRQSMARTLGAEEARRQHVRLDDDMIFNAILRLRRTLGLETAEDIENWMAQNHLTQNEFMRLMEKEAVLDTLDVIMRDEVMGEMAEHLQLAGFYPELRHRALEKRPTFAQIDRYPPAPELYERALEWFYGRLGRRTKSVHLEAAEFGFRNGDEFRRAILAEYIYSGKSDQHED